MPEDKVVNKGWENVKGHEFQKGDNTGKSAAGKIGGVKSGESKRRMKTFREELQQLLQMEILNKNGEKISTQQNINSALILKAAKGDVRAYEVIRDTLGQRPKDEKEVVVMSGDDGLKVNLELVKSMENKFNASDK